jgi:hypothetical protein
MLKLKVMGLSRIFLSFSTTHRSTCFLSRLDVRLLHGSVSRLLLLADLFRSFICVLTFLRLSAHLRAHRAHLGLKHQMARGFMVSNVDMSEGEGWQFLDDADNTACDVSQFRETVPHVLHFCQRYSIGEYFINKYLFPTDILSCDFPLVELPPLNILSQVNYSHYGDGTTELWGGKNERQYFKRTRHAFMICSLFPALNEAATYYKNHHCPSGANYEQKWNHFRKKEEYMTVTP